MGKWFEEFEVGQIIEHAASLAITQADNVAFCNLTQNTQPLHLDATSAKAAGFKDALINGLYTFSASVGMSVPETTHGTLVANLGYENVKHPAPVFPGDTIHLQTTVESKRASSKPGRGLVTLRHDVLNQDDVLVCTYQRVVMVRCRP